jgi:hypothetical protein
MQTQFFGNKLRTFIGFITILIGVWLFPDQVFAEKKVVGLIEKVKIYPEKLLFHAKLDTGARHSSLNADRLQLFKRNGKNWVRFHVVDRNKKEMTLERPVLRFAKVKQRDGKLQERPVVALDLCIGRIVKNAEVNLVDRTYFIYPLLIGRSYLKGEFAVDPEEKFTTKPDCTIP